MKNVQFENELVALQNNMRNFAFSLTLNRDDAEDLLQDTTLLCLSSFAIWRIERGTFDLYIFI